MSAIEVLLDGLDHPEGVAYDLRADVVWAGASPRTRRGRS